MLNIRHLLHLAFALAPATALPCLQHERGLRVLLLLLPLVAALAMRDYVPMHALHCRGSCDVHLRFFFIFILDLLMICIFLVARTSKAICSWSFIAAAESIILGAPNLTDHPRLVPLAEDASRRHWDLELNHLARLPRLGVLVAEAALLQAFVLSVERRWDLPWTFCQAMIRPCLPIARLILLALLLVHIDDDFAISVTEIAPGHGQFVLHWGDLRQACLVVVLSARLEAF